MRRRDFLGCAGVSILPAFSLEAIPVLFRLYARQVPANDPERLRWQRLFPDRHAWFEAVAAETVPCAAVVAIPGGAREPEGWKQWTIVECRGEEIRGFGSLAERWSSPLPPNSETKLAIFRIERS